MIGPPSDPNILAAVCSLVTSVTVGFTSFLSLFHTPFHPKVVVISSSVFFQVAAPTVDATSIARIVSRESYLFRVLMRTITNFFSQLKSGRIPRGRGGGRVIEEGGYFLEERKFWRSAAKKNPYNFQKSNLK